MNKTKPQNEQPVLLPASKRCLNSKLNSTLKEFNKVLFAVKFKTHKWLPVWHWQMAASCVQIKAAVSRVKEQKFRRGQKRLLRMAYCNLSLLTFSFTGFLDISPFHICQVSGSVSHWIQLFFWKWSLNPRYWMLLASFITLCHVGQRNVVTRHSSAEGLGESELGTLSFIKQRDLKEMSPTPRRIWQNCVTLAALAS